MTDERKLHLFNRFYTVPYEKQQVLILSSLGQVRNETNTYYYNSYIEHLHSLTLTVMIRTLTLTLKVQCYTMVQYKLILCIGWECVKDGGPDQAIP